MEYKKETPYVETLQPQTSHGEGHLEKRFSKMTMTGMAFAILKYAAANVSFQKEIAHVHLAHGLHWRAHSLSFYHLEVQSHSSTASSSVCFATSVLRGAWERWRRCGQRLEGESPSISGNWAQSSKVCKSSDASNSLTSGRLPSQYHWAYAISSDSWKNSMVSLKRLHRSRC